jgi:hypothetical protein
MAEWVEEAIVNSAFAELRCTIDTISYGGGCDSRRDKVAAFTMMNTKSLPYQNDSQIHQ